MSRKAIFGAAIPIVAILLATASFVVFEPIQVLPRIRLAPGFSLIDQHGESLTSEDLRGSVTLYTFGYSRCGAPCDRLNATVSEIMDRLDEVDMDPETEIRFVTISFDPDTDTPERLDAYAEEIGADGDRWVLATARPGHVENVVKAGFKTWFERRDDGTFSYDPALVLVDGWGVVRGEYRYQTQTSDADRIVRHLDVLAEEIRNAHGAAALAYEAAHLFLCYP